ATEVAPTKAAWPRSVGFRGQASQCPLVAPAVATVLVVARQLDDTAIALPLVEADGGDIVGAHFQSQDAATAIAGRLRGRRHQRRGDTLAARLRGGGQRI